MHTTPTNDQTTARTEVRRAGTRGHTDLGWLDSHHSFSFGDYDDGTSIAGHGLLLVSNDDRVAAGGGFGTHAHRDMEIVTWVLSGRLAHRDSEGNIGELYPGLAQRMTAGSGIRHSEMNASSSEPVHFVQMWVLPDTSHVPPSYEQRDVNAELDAGGLHPIVSGQDHAGAITLQQRDAVLWGARLSPTELVSTPDATHVHVFVASGSIDLDGAGRLVDGDAARFTAAGTPCITGGPEGAEVLIWATA